MRHVHDTIRYAIPMRVVADEGWRVIAFLPMGTVCRWTHVDVAGQTAAAPTEMTWDRTDVLHTMQIGARHGVRVFFDPDGGRFRSWYVDLLDPLRRTPDGIVTMDCGLDIVADADLRWRWKDEEDFEILQQMGWIGPDDARRLRQEGLRVIERIESRRAPFDEPWAAWCPEPTWPMPELPADWDRVPEGIDCT